MRDGALYGNENSLLFNVILQEVTYRGFIEGWVTFSLPCLLRANKSSAQNLCNYIMYDFLISSDARLTRFYTNLLYSSPNSQLVCRAYLQERESEDLSTSSIFGSAKASQEADNVLIIQVSYMLTSYMNQRFRNVSLLNNKLS